MVNLHYKNLCDLYVKFPDKFDYNMFHGKLIIKKEDYTEEFNNEIINLMFRAWKNEFNNQLQEKINGSKKVSQRRAE